MYLWNWAFSVYCACDSGCVEDQHREPGWVYICYPPVVLLGICSLAEGVPHIACLGLEPVSGRKVNFWGFLSPLWSRWMGCQVFREGVSCSCFM